MKNLKIIHLICLLLISFVCSSQNEESTTRKFIEGAQLTQINKDWNLIATFESGIGEYVSFYPIEVINLKTNDYIDALQLDMYIKLKNESIFSTKTAWVGLDEVQEFINFLEKKVIPNLDLTLKKKSIEYVFKAKEMTFSYIVNEKQKRISIILNNYEKDGIPNYYFWTETQVSKLPNLLYVLKELQK